MPITLNLASQSLEHAVELYRNFVIQTNYYVNHADHMITWSGYQGGISKEVSHLSEYQQLLDSRQYTLLFRDDSFCQLFYKFGPADELLSARLAYYPVPARQKARVIEAGFDEGSDDAITEFENQLPSAVTETHLRLDYDAMAVAHDKLHIQFSSYNSLRIPADKIVLPLSFLDFVFRNDEELQSFYIAMSSKAGYAAALTSATRLSTLIELKCSSYFLTHN